MSRVLVTGGMSGIGRATCELLRAEGVEAFSGDIAPGADVELDVTSEQSWSDAIDRLGDFDGLVNCAGIRTSFPIVEMARLEIERLLAINLVGPMIGTGAAARAWRAAGHGGSIVNVGSLNARVSPFPNQSHYAASKGGLLAFSGQTRVEGDALPFVDYWVDRRGDRRRPNSTANHPNAARRGQSWRRVRGRCGLGVVMRLVCHSRSIGHTWIRSSMR